MTALKTQDEILAYIRDGSGNGLAATVPQWEEIVETLINPFGAVRAVARGVALDLSDGAPQDLYTVPADRLFMPTVAVLRGTDGDASTGVITIGIDAVTPVEWIPGAALTNLDAAGKAIGLFAAGGVAVTAPFAASSVVRAHVTTTVAVACVIDLLGYFLPAP